jgi:F0F1-type ATP synthase assembly protein I
MSKKADKRRDLFKMARLSSVGIEIVLCTAVSFFIGSFADKHLHTFPILTFIFVILGLGAGIYNVIKTIDRNSD